MIGEDREDGDDGRSLGDTVSDTKRQVQKGKDDRRKGGLKAAGSSLMESGRDEMDRSSRDRITPSKYRNGGKIRKSKRKGKRQVKPRD